MTNYAKAYQKAVRGVIKRTHKKGFPVYQCKQGYIVAIYPEGREEKLQKVTFSHEKKQKNVS